MGLDGVSRVRLRWIQAALASRDQKLVLRSALEARRCLVGAALRAFTDPKRTCRKLALHAELRACLLWPARRQTRVAGYQAEQRPEYDRAPHRDSELRQSTRPAAASPTPQARG